MSDGIDISKLRLVRPATTSTTTCSSMPSSSAPSDAVIVRFIRVASAKAALMVFSGVMRLPPSCHTPILGVSRMLSRASVGRYPAALSVPLLTPTPGGLEPSAGLHLRPAAEEFCCQDSDLFGPYQRGARNDSTEIGTSRSP